MKTEVKKLDSTKREMSIEVSGDIVKNKFEDVFKRIAQEAKVKGFRLGHIPRDILEKNFSAVANEQVLKELIPDIYAQALEKEGLEVVELPNICDVKLDRNTLSFKAQLEINPEITVKDYKGIRVTYKKIVVLADEIKCHLDSLKESRKVDNVDDNFARSLGYPNLPELEKAIERQIFIQKDNAQRQRLENEIIEKISRGLDFEVPQSLVNRQLQDLIRQAKVELVLKGMPQDKIQEEEKGLSEKLGPMAKGQVKIYLVLSAIAKKENIPVDEQMPRQVMEFLLKEAEWRVDS